MKEILERKKYNLFDFIRIPMKVCPECTTTIGVNRIISALIPTFKVLITADFVDTALAIFHHETAYHRIYIPLILYILTIVYSILNRALINNFLNVRYDMKIYRHFRSAIIEKRAKLEYKHIEDNKTWDLITRTCNDPLGKISGGMNNLMDIMDIVIQVGSLILILMTNVWWAALVIAGITLPLLILAARGGKEIYKAKKDSQKYTRRADYLHRVLSNRENIEERTMFGYTDDINGKWFEKYEVARKIELKVELNNFIRMKASSLLTVLISIGIIGFLLLPLSKGGISIGMFMGLSTATLNLVQMMSWQLAYVVRQLAENREYLKDLTDFLELSEKEGALDYPVAKEQLTFESIEFKNVSFQYPDTEKYILKDFNLTLKKNRHYAFVGVNGAGKTTITKLLTGMYDNYTGDIFINGRDLREYKLSELKAIFSVVYQDFTKYFISVRDNIRLGNILEKEKHNEKKLHEVIDFMDMKEAMEKLPNGMDTYLGKIKEEAVDFSGGQWQRLAIVRSLYNDAFVRILDEPTAALDPVAESNIYEMFGKVSENQTTIFITHRLGAAKLADEIIVLDDGKVAEKGNHETLLSLGGIYATMFESQRSWYQA